MIEKDIKEIERFYTKSRKQLYSYALSLTRNPETAEDVIHLVFQRLLAKKSPPRTLRPYVFSCIRNAAMDSWRKRSDLSVEYFQVEDSCDEHGERSLTEYLHHHLDQLSENERDTIILKSLEQLTLNEISAVREQSINTVTSWYRRGLQKLRILMEES